jgi:hypothetical protein
MNLKLLWMRAVVLLLTVVAVCNAAGPDAQKKREAAYQATLESYSDVLKPGMTRKYVEDYLRSKGSSVQQFCCLEDSSVFADLLKIGAEKHPWYCSENNVYIALPFDAVEPRKPWVGDLDTLKSITIFRRLEGCL